MSVDIEGTGKVLKTVPKIYDDGLKPAVSEGGKVLARIPRLINAALAPLDKWILTREYNVEETKNLLEIKLANIDPEKIVSPEPYVAVPAIQALSYSIDNMELRNLYANLLAKSMYEDTKFDVHPCFVEIMKQLSPQDVRVLNAKYGVATSVAVDIYTLPTYPEQNRYLCSKNISNISMVLDYDYDVINVSFDNLIRCGIIEIRNEIGEFNTYYSSIFSSKKFIEHMSLLKKRCPDCEFDYEYKTINFTELGYIFVKCCVEDTLF